MIFSKRWLLLFALGVPLWLLTSLWRGLGEVALGWCILLFGMAWLDWRNMPATTLLQIEREIEPKMLAQKSSEALLRIENRAPCPLEIEIREAPPWDMPSDLPEAPLRLTLAPRTRHTLAYHITPIERGDHQFGDIHVRLMGRLGMVQKQWRIPAAQKALVYPNLFLHAPFDLIAKRGRLQATGARAIRTQGIGREFESLRDYMPDDEMRRIDWKATARRGKLVSRQYETERSQNVILLFDVGRTMLAEVDGTPKIDYALNAGLLLAYVATQSDDHVGAMVFSNKAHAFLPPKRGQAQMDALLHTLYDTRATLAETDYQAAFSALQARWRKRSLVICFTDIWDAASSHRAIEEIAALQARHVTLVVSLLDSNLLRAAEREVTNAEDAFLKAAAIQVLQERKAALQSLERRGVLVADTPAEKLSAELVQRYLEIKERLLLG